VKRYGSLQRAVSWNIRVINAADAVVERTGVSNNYRCGMYELRYR